MTGQQRGGCLCFPLVALEGRGSSRTPGNWGGRGGLGGTADAGRGRVLLVLLRTKRGFFFFFYF